MVTVVGLVSGKEFIVCDKSYKYSNMHTGDETWVFITPDHKRVITVPPATGNIEYFDEECNEETIEQLEATRAVPDDVNLVPVVDVNVG